MPRDTGKVAISCVMPVYNGEECVHAAIQSVLKQTWDDFELIIIDDGSEDDTPQVLDYYASTDARISILRNNTNKGIPFSLNRAIASATGRYIARMDADDISHPQRFERQVAFLDNNPDIDLLGTYAKVCFVDGTFIRHHCPPTKHEDIFLVLCEGNAFVHGSVMFRNKGYLYDKNFGYAEDYRLWTQIALNGRMANLPEVLYTWRDYADTVTRTKNHEQRTQTKDARLQFIEALLSTDDLLPYAVLAAILSRRRRWHVARSTIQKHIKRLKATEKEHLRTVVALDAPYHHIGLLNLIRNGSLVITACGIIGYCRFAARSISAKFATKDGTTGN